MEFFNSIQQIHANWKPYKKWEVEQDDKDFQRQALNKKIPTPKEDLDKASEYGRTLVDSINIMDQYSINKAEDVEQASQFALSTWIFGTSIAGSALAVLLLKIPKVMNYIEKNSHNMAKMQVLMIAPTMALTLLTLPFLMIKMKSYEKEASRIARYQAREDELKDPRNFVTYNKEQIEKGKEIAETLPDPINNKKSKNIFKNYKDSFNSIRELIKDHERYADWKQENLKNQEAKIKSFETMEASPTQKQKAKKDQDNLLRAIRKIEIYSQNYLSNTEMALNMLVGSSLITGAIGGGVILGVTKLLQKFKIVSQTSGAAALIKRYALPAGVLGVSLASVPFIITMKKESAKIGRFKAKQELLNDPHNFITYNDEQLDSVKDLKAPEKQNKGFFAKFKDDMEFIFKLRKDYKEYEKYQETDYKKEQKLEQALKKVDVTEEQMKEAKSLQKNAFMSFEKMDEMTQRYSDDTEAATHIVQEYIVTGAEILGLGLTMKNFSKNGSALIENKLNTKAKTFKFLAKNAWPMSLPIIAGIISTIESIQLKKEAGRIGIMKAMQDLEDPKYFVDSDNN